MKLTEAERKVVEEQYPRALRIASRFSDDDDYQSEAGLAVCRAVIAMRDRDQRSIANYVGVAVFNAMVNLYRKKRKERARGLSGGNDSLDRIADSRLSIAISPENINWWIDEHYERNPGCLF